MMRKAGTRVALFLVIAMTFCVVMSGSAHADSTYSFTADVDYAWNGGNPWGITEDTIMYVTVVYPDSVNGSSGWLYTYPDLFSNFSLDISIGSLNLDETYDSGYPEFPGFHFYDGKLVEIDMYLEFQYDGENYTLFTTLANDFEEYYIVDCSGAAIVRGTLNYDSPVPIPGAVWLLGSGLLGLFGARKKFSA